MSVFMFVSIEGLIGVDLDFGGGFKGFIARHSVIKDCYKINGIG